MYLVNLSFMYFLYFSIPQNHESSERHCNGFFAQQSRDMSKQWFVSENVWWNYAVEKGSIIVYLGTIIFLGWHTYWFQNAAKIEHEEAAQFMHAIRSDYSMFCANLGCNKHKTGRQLFRCWECTCIQQEPWEENSDEILKEGPQYLLHLAWGL